jgi:hypothetical protein
LGERDVEDRKTTVGELPETASANPGRSIAPDPWARKHPARSARPIPASCSFAGSRLNPCSMSLPPVTALLSGDVLTADVLEFGELVCRPKEGHLLAGTDR